jgi:hypothetical protein
MQVILTIENPQDWVAILPILERLGISVQATLPLPKKNKRLSAKTLAYHQAIIAQGGDASYFGDAVEWQKEQRQERDLPFTHSNLNDTIG